jgi:acetyltransferase-like isoleucine patch superfamily enzyme
MAKLSLARRAALRFLAWALGRPEDSATHPLNPSLYLRGLDGRRYAPPFFHPQIEVGDHTYGMRRECFFPYHPDDRVTIGKFCSIADGVKFVFGNHATGQVATFPLKALCLGHEPHADSLSKGHIEIGNDVWIGLNAVILSGVKIGDGAVIGAGAVVTKSVEPYHVVGGVPAVVLKTRLRPDQIKSLLQIAWWNWSIDKIKQNEALFYGDVDAFLAVHGNLGGRA